MLVNCKAGLSFKPSDLAQDDDDNGFNVCDTPPTPPSVTSEEKRSLVASSCLDVVFHRAKLRLLCPGRWARLYLAAAKRAERGLRSLRELVFLASSLDDNEWLKELRNQVPPLLWNWWAHDLEIRLRACRRLRLEQLDILPFLVGQEFSTPGQLQERQAALKLQPPAGSTDEVAERQRGQLLQEFLRKPLEWNLEIDLRGLQDILEHPLSGPWKTTLQPARGVNWGAASGLYAGWRAIHFVAGCSNAKKTVLEAGKMLFDAKADPTLIDGSGGTCLHAAAFHAHGAIVQMLLEHGCAVEHVDFSGATALMLGSRARSEDVVIQIVSWVLPRQNALELFDLDLNPVVERFSPEKNLQLLQRVADANLPQVKLLAIRGNSKGDDPADVNFADAQGRRSMHIAVTGISRDDLACNMIRCLVALRADVNPIDGYGDTPLHIAAKLGRAEVVKVLLMLNAAPGIGDRNGLTPLMLAARQQDDAHPPEYDGILVNKKETWKHIDMILGWSGYGDLPKGIVIRKAAVPPDDIKDALMGRKSQEKPGTAAKSQVKIPTEEEDEEKEEEEEKEDVTFKMADAIKAKAGCLACLGFDDQYILDMRGRVNRGDKLQLFFILYNRRMPDDWPRPIGWTQEDEKESAKFQPYMPDTSRVEKLWDNLTAPLLRLLVQELLDERQKHLLHYLLVSALGPRGPAFGILTACCGIGRRAVLPMWGLVEEALKQQTLEQRVEAIMHLGFRGVKPHRTRWVGATWNRDEYPREPDFIPWDALQYVSEDNAPRLHEQDEITVEAFKSNLFPCLEPITDEELLGLPDIWDPIHDPPPAPNSRDQLQLANRLFVQEACGARGPMQERIKLVGQQLLCPLLQEAADGFLDSETAEVAREHHDVLKYVTGQLATGNTPQEVDEHRKLFSGSWKRAKHSVASALLAPVGPTLTALLATPEVLLQELTEEALATKQVEPEKLLLSESQVDITLEEGSTRPQSAEEEGEPEPAVDTTLQLTQWDLLPQYIINCLKKRQSTLAFILMRRLEAVKSVEDFIRMVELLSLGEGFAERYWLACFGLLLYGRAKALKVPLEAELQRRLAGPLAKGARLKLQGPWLRPRSEVLRLSWARETLEQFHKVKGTGRWSKGKPAPTPEVEMELPPGPTDMLRAQIQCEDEESLRMAFEALCAPKEPPKHVSEQLDDEEEGYATFTNEVPIAAPVETVNPKEGIRARIHFRAVHISNGFHPARSSEVFPQAAGVLVTARFTASPVIQKGDEPGMAESIEQLVEVELILSRTMEARWLVSYMQLKPSEIEEPPGAKLRPAGHAVMAARALRPKSDVAA